MASNTRSRALHSNPSREQSVVCDKSTELIDITNVSNVTKSDSFQSLKCEFDKMHLQNGSPVAGLSEYPSDEPTRDERGIKRKSKKMSEQSKQIESIEFNNITNDKSSVKKRKVEQLKKLEIAEHDESFENIQEVDLKCSSKNKRSKNFKKLKATDHMQKESAMECEIGEKSIQDPTKRKTEMEFDNDRKKIKTDELSSHDENVEEEMKYFVAIDSVVGLYYSNIEERINLSFQPICSMNPEMCARDHQAKDVSNTLLNLEFI